MGFRSFSIADTRKNNEETAVKYNGSLALAIARSGDHNK